MGLKNNNIIKAVRVITFVLLTGIIFSSCAVKDDNRLPALEDYDIIKTEHEKKNIKLGVVTGPYKDMFMDMIYPVLIQKGYMVEIKLYEDYVQPNLALAEHQIDLNIFQHYKYLNSFKSEHDLDLSAITEIPTASMGIFSYKYKSLNDLEDGAEVLIPDDVTNLARALSVLEAAGVVRINPFVDKAKSTLNDLTDNPKNCRFILTEAQKITQSLDECDMAVINGNYALAGGLSLSGALYNEKLNDSYMNVIAVRTEDLGKPFVQDIIDAVNSEQFRNGVVNSDGKYDGFQFPKSFYR